MILHYFGEYAFRANSNLNVYFKCLLKYFSQDVFQDSRGFLCHCFQVIHMLTLSYYSVFIDKDFKSDG